MLFRSCLLIVSGLTLAWAQPVIPDTPAGRAFSAWLEAFNSGERSRLDSYYSKYEPDKTADSMMGFRDATGGFDLISIRKTEPLHIEVLVKEKKGETTALGKLDVKDGEGGKVTAFMLRAIPKGATIEDFKIEGVTRSRVIDGALENLNAYYVFPDVAKKMEEAVRFRQKKGEYDSVTDGDSFANMLTSNLQDVSHDKHLRVNFSPAKLPEGPPGAGQDAAAQYRKQMERMNCGFDKVERLAGNVGYLKFGMFADPEVCGPTAIAAMNFLANVDAIIFDLRENGGGDPKMISLLATYLFAKQTHLNDLWERKTDTTQQYWTLPYVPGKRLDDKPVFVLTSKRTFSGAEEFSYDLKNLKRATIIGETTGGGAHPVSGHRIDDHFMIGVPFARAINPTSKTNWEGTGVEPDIKVPAADALTEAQKLAAKKPASN
jgi:hypothetical protein